MKMSFTEFKKMYSREAVAVVQDVKDDIASDVRYGKKLENLFESLCLQTGIKYERSTLEEDVLFGYDFKLAWVHEGKNYSIMIDITGKQKRGIQYFLYSGARKESFKDPFGGELLSAYIGLKSRHGSWFEYKTPVYILELEPKWTSVEKYEEEFKFIIRALKNLHQNSGLPKRASKQLFLLK